MRRSRVRVEGERFEAGEQGDQDERQEEITGPGRTPEDRILNAIWMLLAQQVSKTIFEERLGDYIQREIWMARLVEVRKWNPAKDPHIAAIGLQIQIRERVMPAHWRVFVDG